MKGVEEIEELRKDWNSQNVRVRIKIVCWGVTAKLRRFFYNRSSIFYYITFCAFSRVFRVSESEFLFPPNIYPISKVFKNPENTFRRFTYLLDIFSYFLALKG